MTQRDVEQWMVDAVRHFSPKVVALDAQPDGTYEEHTTRWGINPVYAAIPAAVRDVAESRAREDARAHFAHLRRDSA